MASAAIDFNGIISSAFTMDAWRSSTLSCAHFSNEFYIGCMNRRRNCIGPFSFPSVVSPSLSTLSLAGPSVELIRRRPGMLCLLVLVVWAGMFVPVAGKRRASMPSREFV